MLLRFDDIESQAMSVASATAQPGMGAASAAHTDPTQPAGGQTRLGPGEGGKDRDGGSKGDTGTITKTRPKTKKPSLYRVLLLNDDYTPMEFVVLILQDVFNKTREDAMRIKLHVHNQGVGECGI